MQRSTVSVFVCALAPVAQFLPTAAVRDAPGSRPEPMLPRAQRMRDGESFRSAIRNGKKVTGPDLVVHLARTSKPTDSSSVGFVVSKQVGPAVVRNRVKRQLRHQMASRINTLGPAIDVVIRALPGAAGRSSAELGAQIDAALRKAGVGVNQ